MFCTIALWDATFLLNIVSKWTKCLCTPLCSWSVQIPCFCNGVPMLVVANVVYTFAPLCHLLCIGTQSDRANATKFKGVSKSTLFSSEQDHEPWPRAFIVYIFYVLILLLGCLVSCCLVPFRPYLCVGSSKVQSQSLINGQPWSLPSLGEQGHKPWLSSYCLAPLCPFHMCRKLKPSWFSCGLAFHLYFLVWRKLEWWASWNDKGERVHTAITSFNFKWGNPHAPPCGLA